MKKIMIITDDLEMGGVQRTITNAANMLSSNYEVTILTKLNNNSTNYNINNSIKIDWFSNSDVDLNEIKNPIKKFIYKKKINTIIADEFKNYIINTNFDIYLSNNLLYLSLLNQIRPEITYKIFIELEYKLNDKKYMKYISENINNIDYILTVSNEIKNEYQKLTSKTCYYMPNSIDYIPDISTDYSKNNIVTVGKLTLDKAILDMIDMFYEIHLVYPDIKIDIVGDGIEMDKIKKKIIDLRIKDNVILHGFQNKEYINELLSHSSVFALTSKKESFGLAVLEAMSFGLPCVIFDSASGIREYIKNSVNGYLIPNRDISEMAKKIVLLLNNDSFKKDIGIEAKKTAINFEATKIKNRWINFIESVINNIPLEEEKKEELKEVTFKRNDIHSLLEKIAEQDKNSNINESND